MSEALVAILELEFLPGAEERGSAVLRRELTTTRSFDGCDRADMYVDVRSPARVVLVETWRDDTAEELYRRFRSGDGAIPELPDLLAARPRLVRCRPAG